MSATMSSTRSASFNMNEYGDGNEITPLFDLKEWMQEVYQLYKKKEKECGYSVEHLPHLRLVHYREKHNRYASMSSTIQSVIDEIKRSGRFAVPRTLLNIRVANIHEAIEIVQNSPYPDADIFVNQLTNMEGFFGRAVVQHLSMKRIVQTPDPSECEPHVNSPILQTQTKCIICWACVDKTPFLSPILSFFSGDSKKTEEAEPYFELSCFVIIVF